MIGGVILSLEALVGSNNGVPQGTLKPATPTAMGLAQLLQNQQAPQTRPMAQPVVRSRQPATPGKASVANTGLRSPTMSPQMREMMMRSRNAAV